MLIIKTNTVHVFKYPIWARHGKKENSKLYSFQGTLIMILFEVYYIKISHWGSSVGHLEVHNGYIPMNSQQQMNREFHRTVWKGDLQ